MIHPEDRDLLEAYLAAELDDDELKTLELRLCSEEDLARLMIEISSEETVIREWMELQRTQQWYRKLVNESPASKSHSFFSKSFLAGSLLFTISLITFFGMFHWVAPLIVSVFNLSENVAIVDVLSDGDLRTQDTLCVVNDRLQTGRQYYLNQGMLQLQMDSGVDVVIAGPTTFQLINSNAMRLLRGTMTAKVSQDAIGFEVQTPTLKIVDLGTRFGVHADEAGVSETHVFQGIVNYSKWKKGNVHGPPKLLTAGQSVKQSPNGKFIQSNTNSEILFAKCLMREAGIHKLSGAMNYLSEMPASLKEGSFSSNNNIHVFLERKNFQLPVDIICNTPIQDNKEISKKEPQGQYKSGVIKQGTKVDVYYIHHGIHPADNPELPVQKSGESFLKGDIRFKNRILGILPTDTLLLQTDEILGNPDVQYEKRSIRSAEDTIQLLPDNSSLHLDWILGVSRLNVVRVIVAADVE